jgi:cell division protease FtsH
VNEAALLAVRAGRKEVSQPDFNEAIEKTVAGLQKKTRVLKPEERKLTAYHEAGHALIAAFTPNADPVQKISIIPRGFALGYTMQLPLEDRYTVTRSDLLGKIDILLGGRIAEEMVSGEYSTGAASDLTKATDIARKMITDYGMSDRFRNVALTSRGVSMTGQERQDPFFQREYAESTQQYVDEEVARIIDSEYAKALAILEEKRGALDSVASEKKENSPPTTKPAMHLSLPLRLTPIRYRKSQLFRGVSPLVILCSFPWRIAIQLPGRIFWERSTF